MVTSLLNIVQINHTERRSICQVSNFKNFEKTI